MILSALARNMDILTQASAEKITDVEMAWEDVGHVMVVRISWRRINTPVLRILYICTYRISIVDH